MYILELKPLFEKLFRQWSCLPCWLSWMLELFDRCPQCGAKLYYVNQGGATACTEHCELEFNVDDSLLDKLFES